jgi:hypothetical protein
MTILGSVLMRCYAVKLLTSLAGILAAMLARSDSRCEVLRSASQK